MENNNNDFICKRCRTESFIYKAVECIQTHSLEALLGGKRYSPSNYYNKCPHRFPQMHYFKYGGHDIYSVPSFCPLLRDSYQERIK